MELWNRTDETLLPNCSVDTSYRFTYYQVSYSVIFLLGLTTNSLALLRLCTTRCIMNSTAVYLLSLTAADCCFVISLPMRVYFYHRRAWALDGWTAGAAFCQVTFILKYISLYGGIFFLVCISVDRYSAVVHPLASSRRRLRVAHLVSGGMWSLVLALSVSLPLLRSAAAHRQQPCLLDPSTPHHRKVILLALSLAMASFLVPTVLLLYSYCRVLSVLRQPRHQRRSHRHTLAVIYWVLAVYLVCFVPYHVNLLGYTLTHVGLVASCGLSKATKVLHPVVLSLASFNCCLNPLIYYFSSSLVRRDAAGGRSHGSQRPLH